MKIPCAVALQHIKAGARDHGLNRDGDAIVIPREQPKNSV